MSKLSYTPKYVFIETEKEAIKALDVLSKQTVLAIDTETTGLDPYLSHLLLLQVATPEVCYILNCGVVNPSIWNNIFTDINILKLAHNAVFDYKMIKYHAGASMRPIFDTMLAEQVIVGGRGLRVGLAPVVARYLGFTMDKTIRSDFIGVKRTKFTDEELLYAANDALILHEIYDKQLDILKQDNLERVAALEFKTVVPLAEMELIGAYVDTKKWKLLVEKAEAYRNIVEEQILDILKSVSDQLSIFGKATVSLSSQPSLLKHLIKLGIKVNGSLIEDTTDETLSSIKHPIGPLLQEWRGWNKIVTSYGESFLEKINPVTGRLHAQYKQARADTGRMSSANPNVQQIPSYNENDSTSLNFRACFKAKPGYTLVTADYSQQELRVLAALSSDASILQAYRNGEDLHTRTAINVFGGTAKEVKNNGNRKIAKAVNFLLIFGGSAFTLARRTGLSEERAQDVIDSYFKAFPGVKKYMNKASDFALSKGYSLTVSGRRRYFNLPDMQNEKYTSMMGAVRRKGMNTPIQGSAADVSKQALCNTFYRIEEKGLDASVIMIIHDEIVCEVRKDQANEMKKLLEQAMVDGFTEFFKNVPISVDACIDDTWHH